MARTVTPLTDPKCEAAKSQAKQYKLGDGQGLYLLVKPDGKKVWRMKYKRPNGKENTLTFGAYPACSLKMARDKRQKALSLLAEGVDPMEQARQEQSASGVTFEAVTRQWHTAQLKRGTWSEGHGARVLKEMEANLFPAIGQMAVDTLRTRDLLAPLQAVERRGALDMASRLKQRLCSVMRHAVQTDLIQYNPAQDLSGAIKTGKTKHRPALPLERLGELLERVEEYQGRALTRLALLLSLHVFIRSSEMRFARWQEIDFKRSLWTIPPEREALPGVKHSTRGSKMRDEHLVPLSPQALAVLREIHKLTGTGLLIFPSDSLSSKPMSENTVNAALRRMGYDTQTEVCGHGFRTMACSALTESGLWSRDAVERQMSHKERSAVRAAYIHRAEHLEERRLMLNWWSGYLEAARHEYRAPFEYATASAPNVRLLRRG